MIYLNLNYALFKNFFFQIVLQDQDNRQVRPTNVGEKSFRCEYEGCGKLYTTAHHLKVSAPTFKVFVI